MIREKSLARIYILCVFSYTEAMRMYSSWTTSSSYPCNILVPIQYGTKQTIFSLVSSMLTSNDASLVHGMGSFNLILTQKCEQSLNLWCNTNHN